MSKLPEPLAGTVTVSVAGRTTMLYADDHMSLHQWAWAAKGAMEIAKNVPSRNFVRMLMPITPSKGGWLSGRRLLSTSRKDGRCHVSLTLL